MMKTFICRCSSFPPTVWAALPDVSMAKTTNGPESFHLKELYSPRISGHVVVNILKILRAETYIENERNVSKN